MKLITASIGAALLLGIIARSGIAQETSPQRQRAVQESIIRKATVQDIDHKNRTVTLKGEQGNVFTVKVGEEVKNFDQIKKGDQVTAQYTESLALGIRKSSEPPSASQQETLTRAQPGEKPAGTQVRTTEISATVENIDRDKREVTLRGPEGNTRKLKVGKDVQGFDNLKEGDQVVATYTEEFTIAVRSPQE
jgi:hypothetical protein